MFWNKPKTTGAWGEEQAEKYLQQQGYTILCRNFHSRYGEIDLIVTKDEWRFSGSDFHTGMDIAGYGRSIYGAPIVACGDGTVVKVQNNGGSGYGLFCIIDHGGGYTTLYAHTSSIIVAVGEEVEKGDIIGYVGNSGWVIPSPTPGNPTGGSHLHVEFRIDGMHYDPAQFLY